MALPDPKNASESALLGGSLTWVAGFIDAVGYLTLSHIYAANMSGNSVALAIDSAQTNWQEALAHACPLLAFLPGLVAGATLVEICKRAGVRASLMPAMLVEAVLLAIFLLVVEPVKSSGPSLASTNGWRYVLSVVLLAFAMGFQNGALRRIGRLKEIHTYVTGTMLATANGLTEYSFWLTRQVASPRREVGRIARYSLHHRSLRKAAYAASLWTLYVIGAILGAISLMHAGIAAIAVPIAVLLMIAAINVISPGRQCKRSRHDGSSSSR